MHLTVLVLIFQINAIVLSRQSRVKFNTSWYVHVATLLLTENIALLLSLLIQCVNPIYENSYQNSSNDRQKRMKN